MQSARTCKMQIYARCKLFNPLCELQNHEICQSASVSIFSTSFWSLLAVNYLAPHFLVKSLSPFFMWFGHKHLVFQTSWAKFAFRQLWLAVSIFLFLWTLSIGYESDRSDTSSFLNFARHCSCQTFLGRNWRWVNMKAFFTVCRICCYLYAINY